MKKLLAFLFIMAVPALSQADTVTPRLSLTEPSINSANWGQKLNNNMGLIDTGVGVLSLTNTWSGTNNFTGTASFGSVTKSTFSSTGALTLGNTVAGSTASFTGPVTASSGSFASGLTAGAAALTSSLNIAGAITAASSTTFNGNVGVTGTSTLTVSSNTVLPGATFYQNAPAVISSFTVITATATSFNATVSSLTTVTAQNFTAVASTSTRLNATLVVASTMVPTAIVGTTTNDNANVGNIGEALSCSASATNFPTTTQFGDLCSIVLTAGDWDVAITGIISNTGATFTSAIMGVSVNTGNSGTGLTNGTTATEVDGILTGTNLFPLSLSRTRFSLSAGATIFLKYQSSYTGGPPKLAAGMTARRSR